MHAWLGHSDKESGPVWRAVDRHGRIGAGRVSDEAVAEIIKRAAERAGLNPAQFAGHSLRRGFATTAARNGAPERYIQRQTGHWSVVTLRAYV